MRLTGLTTSLLLLDKRLNVIKTTDGKCIVNRVVVVAHHHHLLMSRLTVVSISFVVVVAALVSVVSLLRVKWSSVLEFCFTLTCITFGGCELLELSPELPSAPLLPPPLLL